MAEGPGITTVTKNKFNQKPYHYIALAEAGEVVRVLDARVPGRVVYLSTERPACLDGWPDDLPQIEYHQRRELSRMAAERWARHGAVNANGAAT